MRATCARQFASRFCVCVLNKDAAEKKICTQFVVCEHFERRAKASSSLSHLKSGTTRHAHARRHRPRRRPPPAARRRRSFAPRLRIFQLAKAAVFRKMHVHVAAAVAEKRKMGTERKARCVATPSAAAVSSATAAAASTSAAAEQKNVLLAAPRAAILFFFFFSRRL